MPITSQGSQTITAFDESGNGASSSFFTEFGFGDIRDLLEDLGQQLGSEDTGGIAPGGDSPASPSPGTGSGASPSPSTSEG